MDLENFDEKPAPRKMRFRPKAQVRKPPKPVAPKTEVVDDAETMEAKELIQRFQDGMAAKPKFEKKLEPVRVTFGYGSAMPSQQYNENMANYKDKAHAFSFREDKEYKEPWNYYSYYPVTLPLRRPYSGNPDLLDDQEFGQSSSTFNETMTNPAMELGLMEENSDSRMLFVQLPRTLPMTKRPTAAGQASTNNSNQPSALSRVERGCGLNELQAGLMGKLLVYKSGAVKLKLGDTIYDVTPGSDCLFAQDVVAINSEEKLCCTLKELNKLAIVTPNVDSILDSFADLGLPNKDLVQKPFFLNKLEAARRFLPDIPKS